MYGDSRNTVEFELKEDSDLLSQFEQPTGKTQGNLAELAKSAFDCSSILDGPIGNEFRANYEKLCGNKRPQSLWRTNAFTPLLALLTKSIDNEVTKK